MKSQNTKTAQDPRRASEQDLAQFEAKFEGDALLERARQFAARKDADRKAAEMVGDAVLQNARKIAARKAAKPSKKTAKP